MKKYLVLFTVLAFLVSGASAQLNIGDEPDLQEYRQPDISVDQDQNTVTATFYLENVGGSFSNTGEDTWLLEIQPRKQSSLSFFSQALSTAGVSEPQTCDDSRPENVHKDMVFSIVERKQISITSPLNGEGSLSPGNYNLIAVSTTGCATGETAVDNPEPVDPYGWSSEIGSFTVEEDDSSVTDPRDPSEPDDTVWISYSNSNECVEIVDDDVPSNFEQYDSQSQCLENQEDTGIAPLTVGLGAVLLAVLIVLVAWRRDILG